MKTTLWSIPAAMLALSLPFSLPATSAAQASAASVGSQASPAAVFGQLLSRSGKETLGVAEAMPADKYSYAPTNGNFQGVRTFAQQLTHLTQFNYVVFGSFGTKPNVDVQAIGKLTSKDDIVKAYQASLDFASQAISTMTAENAFTVLDARGNTRAGWTAVLLSDTKDHYGQMVEYLRANGIVPPASRPQPGKSNTRQEQ